jgi:lipopolysaccharide exporter
LAAPMSIAGSSIAQVFYPSANEAKQTGQLPQLTLKIFEQLLAIGLVPILLLTIVAPDLFGILFGARWSTAGEYAQWMSVWLLFVFISSPLSNIYSIMERQRVGLIVNIFMFSSRLIVLIIGGIKGDVIFTIALYGITGAALWIFNCIYIQHLAGVSVKRILLTIIHQFLYAIPYIILPILAFFVTQNSLLFVLVAVSAGTIFSIFQVYRIKKTVNK